MTRENKLALVLGFGLMLFVCILVSDHLAARQLAPVALNTASRNAIGVPPLPAPGAGQGIVLVQGDRERRELPQVPDATRAVRDPMAEPVVQAAIVPPVDPIPWRTDPLPAPESVRTYTVKAGDTFTLIAHRAYDRKSLGEKLASYNGTKPESLKVGATVKLPALSELDAALADAASSGDPRTPGTRRSSNRFRVYEVKDGDTLYRIAERELGSAGRWQELQISNDDLLKGSNALKAGMHIKIPEARTSDA
ncbi:MAG: LysM peptidoglycan-binding domain-containing protein [Phycisphaerae bacterium]|nr:LysM peptidoglycan-binding domain-containing protein [Phycisphaerae bacterium]